MGNGGPVRGNRWPRKGNRRPCNRNRAPFNGTKPLLIAPAPPRVLVVGVCTDSKKGPMKRSWPDLMYVYVIFYVWGTSCCIRLCSFADYIRPLRFMLQVCRQETSVWMLPGTWRPKDYDEKFHVNKVISEILFSLSLGPEKGFPRTCLPEVRANFWCEFLQIGSQNLFTNAARRVPHKHLEGSLVYMYFDSFSLENKLFAIHQTLFLPVEVFRAENSDRKHLWCILFPPKKKKKKKTFILCAEGPNGSEISWEVFGWFFAIGRL